jgi:hypothetical protein
MATKKNTTKGVKKGTKRGPYNKKKNKPTSESDGFIETPTFIATYKNQFDLPDTKQIPVKEVLFDEELEQLRTVCNIFNNWTDEQKLRNIRFIVSKFNGYFDKA